MALRSPKPGLVLPMRVWDAPTRLFHWALVLLIAVSYAAISFDWIALHLISGYCVIGLLLFRLIWGVVGSDTARFSRFLRSPLAGLRYLAHFGGRAPDTEIGHNAAGGWMVVVMLALIAVQAGTGLCANDDGATEGPLAKYVGKAASDRLSGLHSLSFYVLLGAVVLHIVAILVYAVVKRQNLVRPMITGKKRLPAATPAPRMASPALAGATLAVCALAVWLLATRV